MRIMICGPARHGKDTLADILSEAYGLSYESSSRMALRIFLRRVLEVKYGLRYATEEQAFEDRFNHRKIWYEEIKAYNKDDLTKLSRKIFEHHDIYVGIRDREEFLASRSLTDLTIWVDARGRLPVEGEHSFSDKLIQESDCDITVDNSGSLDDLDRKASRLFEALALSH